MSRPASPPTLDKNDAHVWMFSTDISEKERGEFRSILSPEERARADRFAFDADRIRFLASHAKLRMTLASYCGIRPETLTFGTGPHGKPVLLEPPSPIQFNLSHSGERAAVVVTLNRRCGIDIEKVRSKISDQAIAERFFCSREIKWLEACQATQRIQGFFRLWCVKEAILKADGKGLSIPLSDVDTTDVLSGASARVTLPASNGRELRLWVEELTAPEGYAFALAVEGKAPLIQLISEDH